MLCRPRHLLTAHNSLQLPQATSNWSSRRHQQQTYLSHKQLAKHCKHKLDQLSWDKTAAKLVAQWSKTITKRQFHSLRRSMVKQSASGKQVTSCPTASKTEDISASTRRYSAYGGEPPPGESDVCKEDMNQAYVRRDQGNSPDRGFARNIDLMEQLETGVASRLPGDVPEDQEGERRQTPEEYIAHRKAVIIERIMAAFQRWLDKRLAIMSYTIEASEAAEAADGPGDSRESEHWDSGERKSGDASRRPKRQFPDDSDPDNSAGGGDDSGQDRGGNKRAKKESDPEGVKFACHFHKHNPKAHTKKTCMTGSWKSIHRLKEHLYRVHLLPKYKCPRCNLGFDNDKELKDHLRADDNKLCKKSNVVREEGIDQDTERKLRERKKHNSGQTETQRWIEIYLLLFPAADKDAIPSPYPDYDGTTARSSRDQFRRVEKRIKKDLPRIFKKQLERKLGKMENQLLKDVPDLLRNSIAQVFKDMPGEDISSPTTSQSTSRATTPGPSLTVEPTSIPSHEEEELDPEFDMGSYLGLNEEEFDLFGLGPLGGLSNLQSEMDDGGNISTMDKISSDSGYVSTSTHATIFQ